MSGVFVTGTDTGVGKTSVTVALMHWARRQGMSVAGMKPVASGCSRVDGELRNADAVALQYASSVPLTYGEVNPYGFEPPVSPHLAAKQTGVRVNKEFIAEAYRALAKRADHVVVEGVGGWMCPLNEQETVAEMALFLGLPVILVVGLRLGCVSHALLTEQAIRSAGGECVGWVGNQAQPEFSCLEANLADLQARLRAPLLGYFPYRGAGAVTVSNCTTDFDQKELAAILRRPT